MKIACLNTSGLALSQRGVEQLTAAAQNLHGSTEQKSGLIELSLLNGSARGSVSKTGRRGSLITIGGPLFVGTFTDKDGCSREVRFVLDDRYLPPVAPTPTDRPGADKTRW